MLYLPSARRLILPSLVCLMILTLVHLIIQQLAPSPQDLFRSAPWTHQSGTYIPSQQDHVLFDHNGHTYHSSHASSQRAEEQEASTPFAPIHPRLADLLSCRSRTVNPITSQLRLPNPIRNISMIPPSSPSYDPTQRFFNPAIIPLPHWSGKTTYVLVTRLVTVGHHQESHICLADICHPPPSPSDKGQRLPPDVRICTDDDITVLGPQGGMRCITPPRKIDIPSTPAHACSQAWLAFPDIPGFHDPRVFWSGKGEPLILVNSASQYGCVGLWIIDLRPLFPELEILLKRHGRSVLDTSRPLTYESLTEITRNPRSSRSPVEKNWMLWFPNREDAYVQFDLLGGGVSRDATHHSEDTSDESKNKSTTRTVHDRPMRRATGGRTFAKLIGNGYTTPNLTSPLEQACFDSDLGHDPPSNQPSSHRMSSSTANNTHDSLGQIGHWHQGSNSLRLILCTRAEARRGECDDDEDKNNNDDHDDSNHTNSNINSNSGRSVHFAVINRKFSNAMALPLRYERYIMVWEGRVPFRILGISRWPLVWRDEWVRPWTFHENFHFRNAIQGHETETETNASMRSGSDRWRRRGEFPVQVPQSNHSHSILTDRPGPEREQDQILQHDGHHHHHQQQQYSDIPRNSGYAYFTYTPSLAWSWMPHSSGAGFEKGRQQQDQPRGKNHQHHGHRHEQHQDDADDDDDQTHDNHPNQFQPEDDALYLSRLGTGYLGDDVLVGVGLDDVNQGFVRVKVDDLVSCLRLCPGVRRV